MKTIRRCEKHDTTFISEEDSIFDRCFVCVFEENEELKKELDSNLTWFKWMTTLESDNISIHRSWIAEALDQAKETKNAT